MPSSRGVPARASAPASLSSALCRPTSSRTATSPASGRQNAAACTARVSRLSSCRGASASSAAHDLGRREDGPVAHAPQRPHRLVEAFDAAEPAAGRAGEMPPPLAQGRGARGSASHMRSSMPVSCSMISRWRISRRRSDDAFGEAEAEREILEVLRRRHHHRIGAAVVGEGDGGLLGDDALAVGRALAAPDRARDGNRRIAHAATPRPRPCAAMRRLLRASSSYCSCHSVGPLDGVTCTAVTLYSGQLVAQSEYSVVTTLACVFGMVEGRVDHARRHALGDRARAAWSRRRGSRACTQSPSRMPRCSASCGWISSTSSSCQTTLAVRRVCAPTLYWLRMRPVVRSSGIARPGLLVGRDVFGDDELALAAHEAVDVHDRRALRRLARCTATGSSRARRACSKETPAKVGVSRGDLVHDLGRMVVAHRIAHGARRAG